METYFSFPLQWNLIFLLFHVIGILSGLNAILRARTAEGAIAWFMALSLFPYLTLPIYWTIGRSKFYGYQKARKSWITPYYEHAKEVCLSLEQEFPAPLSNYDLKGISKLTPLFTNPSNKINLWFSGDELLDHLLLDIQKSQTYILLQTYILKFGRFAEKIAESLKESADRGVHVYLIYDDMGTTFNKTLKNLFNHPNIHVSSFKSSRSFFNRWQINFRNHRKVVVLDGRIAYMGGINIGDEYLGEHENLHPWYDAHFRCEGGAALSLQLSFLEDWYWIHKKILRLKWQQNFIGGDVPTYILPTGPADTYDTCALVYKNLIQQAKRSIRIAVPYFVPDNSMLEELTLAHLRGVEIEIYLSKHSDNPTVTYASFFALNSLLKMGISIFVLQKGFNHGKFLTIDEEISYVGTANFDNRSFRLNFELMALFVSRPINEQLQLKITDFRKNSKPLKDYSLGQFSLLKRVAIQVARLFAPIL